jgi:hypothetical protein
MGEPSGQSFELDKRNSLLTDKIQTSVFPQALQRRDPTRTIQAGERVREWRCTGPWIGPTALTTLSGTPITVPLLFTLFDIYSTAIYHSHSAVETR